MNSNPVIILRRVGTFLLVLFGLGFGIGSGHVMPKRAIVLINIESHEYFAPPCVMPGDRFDIDAIVEYADSNGLLVIRSSELTKEYKSNHACLSAGGFDSEGRSLSGLLLEWAGILPPLKDRWNEDGSWNW